MCIPPTLQHPPTCHLCMYLVSALQSRRATTLACDGVEPPAPRSHSTVLRATLYSSRVRLSIKRFSTQRGTADLFSFEFAVEVTKTTTKSI
jgi:hypothetical protein